MNGSEHTPLERLTDAILAVVFGAPIGFGLTWGITQFIRHAFLGQ